MRRLSSGARRNGLEGARPFGSAPTFSTALLFDGAIVISAPTLPGTLELSRYRFHQTVPPSHLCLKFHRRPPFLADAKPDSQSSTFRARSLPVPTRGPGRGTLTARSTTQRAPLFLPAIFGLKDRINQRVTYEQRLRTHRPLWRPGQQSLCKVGAPFTSPLLRRREPKVAQEPSPSRECLSDRCDPDDLRDDG